MGDDNRDGNGDTMMVDEPQDQPKPNKNFQPLADSRDRKSRLAAALQCHQQSSKPKAKFVHQLLHTCHCLTSYLCSMPGKLLLPKATTLIVVNKPRGLAKGWFDNKVTSAAAPYSQDAPPTSPQEVKHPEHPSISEEPQV